MAYFDELESVALSRVGFTESYSGDVEATECYKALVENLNSLLVDVRTDAEWSFSGVPDSASIGGRLALISLKLYPTFSLNDNFLQELNNAAPKNDTAIFFLCKTGGRSREAAILARSSGYRYAFNVANGFEGDHNHNKQRGKVNGWKASGLPWIQN